MHHVGTREVCINANSFFNSAQQKHNHNFAFLCSSANQYSRIAELHSFGRLCALVKLKYKRHFQ